MTNPPPGFYDHGHGVRRWWDGGQWTEHVEQAAVPAPVVRSETLNHEVAQLVARGFTVELMDGQQAILSRRIPMSVLANLIGVLLTGGLWLIYILVRIASPQVERRVVTVDAEGAVTGGMPKPGPPPRWSPWTITGFVLSILAVLFSLFGGGIIFAIVGLVAAGVGFLRQRTQLAVWGIALSGVALIVSIITLAVQASNGG